jgi:hypothetical protein
VIPDWLEKVGGVRRKFRPVILAALIGSDRGSGTRFRFRDAILGVVGGVLGRRCGLWFQLQL